LAAWAGLLAQAHDNDVHASALGQNPHLPAVTPICRRDQNQSGVNALVHRFVGGNGFTASLKLASSLYLGLPAGGTRNPAHSGQTLADFDVRIVDEKRSRNCQQTPLAK